MKLLITGSRNFDDYNVLKQTIEDVQKMQGEKITILLHGGAKGADLLAQNWADENNISTQIIKPDYEKYNGKIIHRLRPPKEAYISSSEEQPYEIHFISFDSENDLAEFLKDDTRQKFMHLKNESVQSSLLIKGEKM